MTAPALPRPGPGARVEHPDSRAARSVRKYAGVGAGGLPAGLLRPARVLPLLALASAVISPPAPLRLQVPVGGKLLYLADLLLPAAAVWALRRRSRTRSIDWLFWLLAVAVVIALLHGGLAGYPFGAFVQDTRGPVYLLCGYAIASREFERERCAKAAIGTALGILWITLALMLASILTGRQLLSGRVTTVTAFQAQLGTRVGFDATRFLLNPKNLGYLALVIGVVLLLSNSTSARRSRRWGWAFLVPGTLITFLAFSRASLLAVAVALLVVVVAGRRVQLSPIRVTVVLGVLAGVVGLLGVTGAGGELNNPTGNLVARHVAAFDARVLHGLENDNLVAARGNQWRLLETDYALTAIGQSPLLGHGLGAAYRPEVVATGAYQAFRNDPTFGSRFLHNVWLFYWVKTGLVGLLALATLMIVPAVRAVLRQSGPHDPAFPVDVALAAGLLGLVVGNFFTPDLQEGGSAPLVGAVIGYLAVQASGADSAARGRRGRRRTTELSPPA